MALFATNGAKIYIGGAVSDKATNLSISDFTGQTWVEIGESESLGSLGDTSSEISIELINRQRTKRMKGTRNAGTMEIVFGLDHEDLGQIALLAAEKAHHNYAFKIVLNDAPPEGTPSERYFFAIVGSAVDVYDAANNVAKLTSSLWVNSNVVKINAAASGSAPDNTVLPAITGTAEVGETLTASAGTWTGTAPITYGYRWFAGGEAIPGANAATYVPVGGDTGKAISVLVTASNPAGTGQAISAATSAVAP